MTIESEPEMTADAVIQSGSARRLELGAERGTHVRIRRGAYVRSSEWGALDARRRHLARIQATRLSAKRDPVFSHESAALLWGIPILGEPPERTRVTVTHGLAKSNAAVIRSRRPLAPGEVARTTAGPLATDPVRTAVDLAAGHSGLAGIIAISHVRRHFGACVDEFDAALARMGSFKGVARARAAVRRSVEGSDTPLETLVSVRCEDLGFERPVQQFAVRGVDGERYLVDFAWLGGEILGESDGRMKYFDPDHTGGRTAEQVLWREKRREDALRPVCRAFVRVTWDEAWAGAPLERRLEHAGVPRVSRRRPLTW